MSTSNINVATALPQAPRVVKTRRTGGDNIGQICTHHMHIAVEMPLLLVALPPSACSGWGGGWLKHEEVLALRSQMPYSCPERPAKNTYKSWFTSMQWDRQMKGISDSKLVLNLTRTSSHPGDRTQLSRPGWNIWPGKSQIPNTEYTRIRHHIGGTRTLRPTDVHPQQGVWAC